MSSREPGGRRRRSAGLGPADSRAGTRRSEKTGPEVSAGSGIFRQALSYIRGMDLIIIAIYLALFGIFLALSLQNVGAAGSIVVQSSGVEYRYSFDKDQTLEFDGPIGKTIIQISSEGKARFEYSDCRDKICVDAGWLDKAGEWAACLPNRVILRLDSVEGGSNGNNQGNGNVQIDATAF